MKKYLKYSIFAFVAALTLSSCNDDDSRFDSDIHGGWVQFEDAAPLSFTYGGVDQISIPVDLNAPVNTRGLQVNYTINVIEGSVDGAFASPTGSFEIPVGTNEGNLTIALTEAGLTSRVIFDITLTTTSRENVQVGLSDNSRPIVKRICLAPLSVVSSYSGAVVASLDGDVLTDGPAFTATVTPVAGQTDVWTINTAWGPNYVATLAGNPALAGQYLYPATLTLDRETGEFTVVTTGNPALYTGGTGNIDACSGVITLVLEQGLFTNPILSTVTLTPN